MKLLRIHFIIFFGDFINFIRLEIVTLLSDKLFEKKVFYSFIICLKITFYRIPRTDLDIKNMLYAEM